MVRWRRNSHHRSHRVRVERTLRVSRLEGLLDEPRPGAPRSPARSPSDHRFPFLKVCHPFSYAVTTVWGPSSGAVDMACSGRTVFAFAYCRDLIGRELREAKSKTVSICRRVKPWNHSTRLSIAAPAMMFSKTIETGRRVPEKM